MNTDYRRYLSQEIAKHVETAAAERSRAEYYEGIGSHCAADHLAKARSAAAAARLTMERLRSAAADAPAGQSAHLATLAIAKAELALVRVAGL